MIGDVKGQLVSPKCPLTFTGPHGVMYMNMELFIGTAVRSSNPINSDRLQRGTVRGYEMDSAASLQGPVRAPGPTEHGNKPLLVKDFLTS
jgi:hypothetical protein